MVAKDYHHLSQVRQLPTQAEVAVVPMSLAQEAQAEQEVVETQEMLVVVRVAPEQPTPVVAEVAVR